PPSRGHAFLAREEWTNRGPRACGWQAQGKKVSLPPLRQGDRGFAVLWPDQAIKRPRTSRARQPYGRRHGEHGPRKRPGSVGERTETLAYRKAVAAIRDLAPALASQTRVCRPKAIAAAWSKCSRKGGPCDRDQACRSGIRRDTPNRR